MFTPLTLPAGEAHLYYLLTDEPFAPDLLERYRSWMNEEETARCNRYYFEHSRKEYLLTRALIRGTLSLYADVAPQNWEFVANSHGRPEISAPRQFDFIRFNLSNTSGLIALLLIRDRDVGVDVEDLSRTRQTIEIADRYFSQSEVHALHALPSSMQHARFFEYWTLKEAYIKARGLGLAIPLEQFSFLLDPLDAPIRIAFDSRLEDHPPSWQFAQFFLSPRHAAAAAIRQAAEFPLTFRIRKIIPGMPFPSDSSGIISRR